LIHQLNYSQHDPNPKSTHSTTHVLTKYNVKRFKQTYYGEIKTHNFIF